MKQYRVLSLTDHSKHSAQNSIYALLRKMSAHVQCASVDVGSRSIQENNSFFNGENLSQLYVINVDNTFAYDSTGENFYQHKKRVNPIDYDIIFMRLPRPISDEYLYQLKNNFPHKIFINDPSGIILTSNKKFLLNFQELCPPIALCQNIQDVLDFSKNQEIVLKPLKEYGGTGILRIAGSVLFNGTDKHDTVSYLKTIESNLHHEGYLAMRFLKNVSAGDKRLIVVDGQILASSLRLPPKDSWICNVALGGISIASQATAYEQTIVNQINPILKSNGILMYGVDTLLDDNHKRTLSEINTLSIGGFPQAEVQTGLEIIKMTLDKIFNYADQQ